MMQEKESAAGQAAQCFEKEQEQVKATTIIAPEREVEKKITVQGTKSQLLSYSKSYLKKGYSVIVTGKDKNPVLPWKRYTIELITETDFADQLKHRNAFGIGLVCGAVSGNVEVLDIDTKYDLTGTMFDDFCKLVNEQDPDLLFKVPIIETPSGGKHILYKCECIEENKKLAQRPTTAEERKNNPNQKVKVLFETRGEGGQVVTFPTIGYKIIRSNEIPIISLEERDILLNTARSFHQVIERPKEKVNTIPQSESGYIVKVHDDYNSRVSDGEVISLLESNGWKEHHSTSERIYFTRPGKQKGISADYHKDKRLFRVWSTSTEFDSDKPHTPTGIYNILKHAGNISETLKDLEKQGYGVKDENYRKVRDSILNQKSEQKSNDEIKTALIYEFKLTNEQAEKSLMAFNCEAGEIRSDFWDVELFKRGKVVTKKITINRRKFTKWLSGSAGVYLYYLEEGSAKYIFIKQTGCLIEEITIEQIKKIVQDHIYTLPETFDFGTTQDELLEVIYKGADTYFSKAILEFLPILRPDFLTDTPTTAYLPFKNCIVSISDGQIKQNDYRDLNKIIWKSNIIDFEIRLPDDDYLPEGEFYTFIRCICGIDGKKVTEDQEKKLVHILTTTGYLLHKYKDPSKPYAIVLAEETDSDEKGGGTGKGLFVQALNKVLTVVDIDGKTFDPNSQFAWQRVNPDTTIIAIQDTKKFFNIESLFNPITEGIPVQKKHKDEFFLPYSRSPKFIITTNYTIDQSSNAAKRRQKVFEFSPFFTPSYNPEQHFGHKLFTDWPIDEWNRFYCFLFWCVKAYMESGIVENAASDAINRKYIKQKYSEDFFEWFQEYSSNGCNQWKSFSSLFDQFLEMAGQGSNRVGNRVQTVYTNVKFKSGLREAAEKWGFKLEERRNSDEKRRKELRLMRIMDTV